MAISLKPEDKNLIQKRMKSGIFKSVEEVIHDALASQDSEAEWLIDNKVSINKKIARGVAQLDRGEGVSGDVARARLQRRKADSVWNYYDSWKRIAVSSSCRGVAVNLRHTAFQQHSNSPRRRSRWPHADWHLDEVFVRINGQQQCLWRAIYSK